MTEAAKDASSTEASKTTDEAKDLNSLLADWDEPKKTDKSEEPSKIAALEAQVRQLTEAEGVRSYEAEMRDTVIPALKGDIDVDDFIVESWVNKQAADDARLRELWDNRGDNKSLFEQAIKALAPEFQKFAEEKFVKKTEASNTLAAAVKTARESDSSSSSMDDVDFGSLSDADFALKKAEVFRLAKANKL